MTNQQFAVCPECGGDGKDTCNNPDHGLIRILSFTDEGRLGCPCCGHHPQFKMPKGGDCDICEGKGKVTIEKAEAYLKEYDGDEQEIDIIEN